MKTGITILFSLLFSLSTYSQKEKGTITLINGDVLFGLVKIGSNSFKFKKNKEDKAVFYSSKEAKSATIINEKNLESVFEFVYFDFRKEPLLLKKEINGTLSLYSNSVSYYNGAGFNSTSTFYLKKEKDKLGQWFLCYGYIPKKSFKNVIEDYFTDCPELQKKVENKEFKKDDFDKIVFFYNENCGK